MAASRIGFIQLRQLRTTLSDRDLAILRQVGELKLMTARQIEAVHFGPERHASAVTATRTCARVLHRLASQRLLLRLDRRVGGLRGGSMSYCYALAPVGQRIIEVGGPRRRFHEPSVAFLDHTLAIGQLVVDLTLAAGEGQCDLLAVEPEPRCWRPFSGMGGRQVLRPDLFVSLGVQQYECRYFVEVDRGQEHAPQLVSKCRLYDTYYRTGIEQVAHDVFPRVLWVVPDERRVGQLEKAINGSQELTKALFSVALESEAVATLCGAPQ
jgi:hypothetical protein